MKTKKQSEALTDFQINSFFNLEEKMKQKKKEFEEIVSLYKESEQTIIEKIRKNPKYKSNRFLISIKKNERRTPSWKNHFAELAGQKRVLEVIASTEPKITEKLVVAKRKEK